MNKSQPDKPLTALERELLNCVERLVSASETSAEQFNTLEKRSTGSIMARQNVVRSLREIADGLSGLVDRSVERIRQRVAWIRERAESLARERNSARASHKSHEADAQVTAQRPAQTQFGNQQIRTPSRGQSRSR